MCYPPDIFENFLIQANYTLNKQSFGIAHFGEPLSEFPEMSIDFEVLDQTFENFQLKTGNDFSYYYISWRSKENSSKSALWAIISDYAFDKPLIIKKLPKCIQGSDEKIKVTDLNLKLQFVEEVKLEKIPDFHAFRNSTYLQEEGLIDINYNFWARDHCYYLDLKGSTYYRTHTYWE